MSSHPYFKGFSPKTVEFFLDLAANNDRDWFEENRKRYKNDVAKPSELFVEAMGERLRALSPMIQAIPKVNQSLFRINRDTRFSPDKSPYKTHLGILFWEPDAPKMESTGFYFHLEPPEIMLAAGMHMIPKYLLEPFREAVMDEKQGPELADIVRELREKHGCSVGGQSYKRVPRGYPADHERGDLLRHSGVFASRSFEIDEALFGPQLLDLCFDTWKTMQPLNEWFVELIKSP